MREKVFLAGTDDVKYIMGSLEKELKEMGYDPIWFHKQFKVDSEDTMKSCLDNVSASKRLILVLDKRYGLIYRDAQHSITEEEFLAAYNDNKPILIFIEQETYDHSKIFRKTKNQGTIITDDNKKKYGFKADIELFEFIDRIQHLKKDGKLNIKWIEKFNLIEDIVEQIKLKWGVRNKNIEDDLQKYNLIESRKFQKFLDILIEKDKDNIGTDLNNILNNIIGIQKFRTIMGFYPSIDATVFNNNKWQLFLCFLDSGYIAEITNLISGEVYNLFKPEENVNVLNEFLEYTKSQLKKNKLIILNQENDLFGRNIFHKSKNGDRGKWQKFYNRMANTDPKHLGIDIQYILNNMIFESDFEKVLKMNVGAKNKYFKIYSNPEWFFSFLNRRMGGDHYEIFVRCENTQQTYDFFHPEINNNILKEWLSYIVEYCTTEGIKIQKLKDE